MKCTFYCVGVVLILFFVSREMAYRNNNTELATCNADRDRWRKAYEDLKKQTEGLMRASIGGGSDEAALNRQAPMEPEHEEQDEERKRASGEAEKIAGEGSEDFSLAGPEEDFESEDFGSVDDADAESVGAGVPADPEADKRREEVKVEFTFAWDSYERYAWGEDHLKPVSRSGESSEFKMGLTIVDALDTCLLMELGERCDRGLDWIRDNLQFTGKVNIFETTIRSLGGLLSAYTMTGKTKPFLLNKAKELADKLMIGFKDSEIPKSDIDLRRGKASTPIWGKNAISTSEAGTLQLEFALISELTGDLKYKNAADRAQDLVIKAQMSQRPPLVRRFLKLNGGGFTDDVVSLGSRTDSTYEYYLKRYIQSLYTKTDLWNAYLKTVETVRAKLLAETPTEKLLYIKEITNGRDNLKMDHLVCFYPGMLALAVMTNRLTDAEAALETEEAERLADTCYHAFYRTATGLAPEIVKFNPDPYHTATDAFSILRPEAVESWFYLWRLTKKQKFRDYAYTLLQSLKKSARTENGYASVSNVDNSPPLHRDKMESFFLAETMKYLYLIFSDDHVIPLDKFVFNTEAHPLPFGEVPY